MTQAHDYHVSTDYYQMTIAWINSQYANYPTKLVRIPLSEAELSEMSYWDAIGQYCTAGAETGEAVP